MQSSGTRGVEGQDASDTASEHLHVLVLGSDWSEAQPLLVLSSPGGTQTQTSSAFSGLGPLPSPPRGTQSPSHPGKSIDTVSAGLVQSRGSVNVSWLWEWLSLPGGKVLGPI